MEFTKYLLGAIVLVSVLEWETPPNTSLAVHFGIEGTYVPFLAVRWWRCCRTSTRPFS